MFPLVLYPPLLRQCTAIFAVAEGWLLLESCTEKKIKNYSSNIAISGVLSLCTQTCTYSFLRPYVQRKSDLPLYIGQIHAFYFNTTPYTLNDDVNTKSV